MNQLIINKPKIAYFQTFAIHKYKQGDRMIKPPREVKFEQAHRVEFQFKHGVFYEADLYFGDKRTVCDLVIVNKE